MGPREFGCDAKVNGLERAIVGVVRTENGIVVGLPGVQGISNYDFVLEPVREGASEVVKVEEEAEVTIYVDKVSLRQRVVVVVRGEKYLREG